MSGIIWNPPILSPIIIAYSTMDNANKSLKRTRSTEIDDINTKRSKHTVNEQELTRIYPYNHHHATTIPTIEDNKLPLKPISISTRSPLTPTVTTSLPHYEHINTVLHSLHVTRYGNPELRERWWEHEEEEEELDEMEVDRVDEYHDMNSMLKTIVSPKTQAELSSNLIRTKKDYIDIYSTILLLIPFEDYVSHVSQIFLTGKTKDIKWRKQQLQNLYNMVKENEEAFYEALAKDLNKPRPEALGGDIAPVLDECLYFIDNLDRLAKDQKVKARLLVNAFEKTIIRREPLGTVLVIGCWNYPVQLALCPLVGVIAAGNVAILKLSEISVHTSALITRLFSRYMDASCYRVVNGSVMETTALLQHKFDHIFYTGNSTVAKIIMEAAAKHLTPVTLELGGKSPAIVAEDADITLTATRVAFGKFFNAGQTCIAVDYVLIHQSRADEFISALRKAIDKFYGSNAAKSKDYVRIINDRHFERLSNVLKNRKSGEIAIGGDFTKETRYISPTVIKNVAFNDPSLMGDELFGPLLPVITYNNIDEAICNINKKDHPLALYIFSNKKPLVEKVLRQVRSGGVTVNDCLMHQAEYAMPFGGVGASGMGHYHGERSFLTFSHERSMLIKKQSGEAMMSTRYPPYNSSKYNMMRFILVKHPAFIWLKTYSKSLKFVTLLMALISFYFKRRA